MLNKKGFTIVELIMSFAFVGILSASLFAAIVNYRDKELETATITDLIDFKSLLTIDVQTDIETKVLNHIDYCRDSDNNIISRCIDLYFNDGDVKEFSIKSEIREEIITTDGVTDTFSYRVPYISYGGIRYMPPDASNVTINSDFLLEHTTLEDALENKMSLYKINVSFVHNDYDQDIGISIVALGSQNLESGAPAIYEEFSMGDKVEILLNGHDTASFNVIKDSGKYEEKLLLLLDHNYNNSVFNISEANGNRLEGSSIEASLEDISRNWINADKVRLITAEEVGYFVYACPKYQGEDASDLNLSGLNSKYSFLTSTSYWTSSPKLYSNGNNGKKVWYVNSTSKKMTDASVNSTYGVRPVIEISKIYVQNHTR